MFKRSLIFVRIGIILFSSVSLIGLSACCVDLDSDGHFGQSALCPFAADCDDNNRYIYPVAFEFCNDGIDNQCPGDVGYGIIDEDCEEQISTGCFDMGDAFSEGNPDELPVHNVCISAFEIDIHEVTNAEYAMCVDDSSCTAPYFSGSTTRLSYYGNPAYDDFPVIWINWYQAKEYCTWAGKRLPTEAEWEYAARGGLSAKRYPWGDMISGSDANYWGSGDPWDDDTSEVRYYAANGYGLYDIAGNIWEWVNDWYDESYYQDCYDGVFPYCSSPPCGGSCTCDDPTGPASGVLRVLRGGSWGDSTELLRVAQRLDVPAELSGGGFRCAR